MLPITHQKEWVLYSIAFAVRVAVFLGLWWLFALPGNAPDPGFTFPVLGGDSADYFTLTHNLFYNHIFSSSYAAPFIPESFRMPGYPFFLYLFQFLPFPMVFATLGQIALGSGSVVLTYLLGKKFLSERVGFVAALLFAFEPTTVFFGATLMSDTLFVFLLLLGVYLLLSKSPTGKWAPYFALAAGTVLGYAVLVRVIAKYFAYCLVLAWLSIYRKELKPFHKTLASLALFGVSMLLVALPWSLRNHRLFNTYTLSSTPYINFTQYNLVYFYAYQHHIPTTEAQHIFSDPIPYPMSSLWFRSLINEPIFKKEMADGLRSNLFPYAKFHLFKTIPFFVNDGLRDINRSVGLLPQPASQINFTDLLLQHNFKAIWRYFATLQPIVLAMIAGSVAWAGITLLGVGATITSVYKRNKKMWFILFATGVIAYFAILSSPVIQPRYRMPAAPFMLLLAAEAGVMLYDSFKKRPAKQADR